MSLKAIALGLLATSALAGAAVAQDKIKIGVSIPAATHGFMGGLNWHAAEASDLVQHPIRPVAACARRIGVIVEPVSFWIAIHPVDH